MATLTDFVKAKRSDAARIAKSKSPTKKWGGFAAKDLDPVKLAQLLAISLKRECQTELLGEFECLAEASSDGPWVHAMPDDLVATLAAMNEKQQKRTAQTWAKIEEFESDGWTSKDVASALKNLCELAESCESEGHAMLVWLCV